MSKRLQLINELSSDSRTLTLRELVYLEAYPRGRGPQTSISAGVQGFTLPRALAR